MRANNKNQNTKQDAEIATIRQEDIVAFSIIFHRMGDKCEGDRNEVKTSADKEWTSITKTLFKSETYEAIWKSDAGTYRWIESKAMRMFGRKGVWLIKKSEIQSIHEQLMQRKADRQVLINAFIAEYPKLMQEARKTLNDQYEEGDYLSPASAKTRFGIDWYYLSMGTPENLPPEIHKEAQEKMEDLWKTAAVQIRDGLRVGFTKLVDHLIEKLTPDTDGKAKRFYDSNVENIVEFINALSARNITNDSQLEQVAKQAKEIIMTASVDQIRKSADIRNNLIAKMRTVQVQAEKMIETSKARKFNLED